MKFATKRFFQHQGGGALVITILTAAVTGTVLVAYLTMIQTQQTSVARSQHWNRCIPVLEAGVEEALQHLNSNPKKLQIDGWTHWSNYNTYYKFRTIGENYTYASISNSSPPVIYGIGYVKAPLRDNQWLYRRVRVTTTNQGVFAKAMTAKGNINLNGNNIGTDSFDSTDPNYSTGGQYDPAKRKFGGDVATISGVVNAMSVGDAKIRGRIATGPGGKISIGPNGSVGDANWHAGGNKGVQPGYSTDDMNITFNDVQAPFSGGALAPTAGTVGTETYNYVLTGGNYEMTDLSMADDADMIVTGDCTLYVTGNVTLTGNSKIKIAPGGKLRLVVAGSTTKIGGSGIANETGSALNFSYQGMPTNTDVTLVGNAGFIGTIYAPQADLRLGGGGSDIYDFIGASVSKTVQMNGHFKFHYDESLARLGPVRAYVVTSWNEI